MVRLENSRDVTLPAAVRAVTRRNTAASLRQLSAFFSHPRNNAGGKVSVLQAVLSLIRFLP